MSLAGSNPALSATYEMNELAPAVAPSLSRISATMPTPSEQFETIDAYISAFPKHVQDTLEAIRRTIQRAAPEAEEAISYRMPAFKLKGHALVYFAAFKSHIGLYPPPPEALKKAVSPYAGPKGNLKFPLDKPIPLDLVKKIAQHRAQQISEKPARKR